MFKPLHFTALFASALMLTACFDNSNVSDNIDADTTSQTDDRWPKLAKRLQCLPKEGALIAAHRAVSRGKGYAENSLESLQALYDGGVRVAEIDVAQLKSGEHILFHDGVWEDESTGRGAVASSRWQDVETYLLMNTEGRVTSSRPSTLKEALNYSKGRLHLEIDFKSSADYGEVIKMVRAAGMTKDVVLIAYNERQARALSKLAPDMYISVSIKKASDVNSLEAQGVARSKMMAWIGRSTDRSLMQTLERQDIAVLTSESGKRREFLEADIFVSDRALDKKIYEGAIGLSKDQAKNYVACLSTD